MTQVTLETLRRVYNDEEGVYIEVRPSPDNAGWVEIVTNDKKSQEWFGTFRFSVDKDMAEALGRSLILAAQRNGRSAW